MDGGGWRQRSIARWQVWVNTGRKGLSPADPTATAGTTGPCRPRLMLHLTPARVSPLIHPEDPPGTRPSLRRASSPGHQPSGLTLQFSRTTVPPRGWAGVPSRPGPPVRKLLRQMAPRALAHLLTRPPQLIPASRGFQGKPLHQTRRRGSERGSDLPKTTQDGGGGCR